LGVKKQKIQEGSNGNKKMILLLIGNTFNYTFNETGSYNFSVDGYPNMRITITVK